MIPFGGGVYDELLTSLDAWVKGLLIPFMSFQSLEVIRHSSVHALHDVTHLLDLETETFASIHSDIYISLYLPASLSVKDCKQEA